MVFGRKPKPVIASWTEIERHIVELGLLGKDGIIDDFRVLPIFHMPGAVLLRWVEVGMPKAHEEIFAVHEPVTGPQCPHCTALQLFVALASAVGLSVERMEDAKLQYLQVLREGKTCGYVLQVNQDRRGWEIGYLRTAHDPHTKYDCDSHRL